MRKLIQHTNFLLRSCCLIITISSTFLFSLDAQAGSKHVTSHGGTGGQNFVLDCGNDAVLVGFKTRSNQWMDAIDILCRKVDSNGKATGATFDPTADQAGGGGGQQQNKNCSVGNAVTNMAVNSNSYVNGLIVRCRKFAAGKYRDKHKLLYFAKSHGNRGNSTCSSGMPARGVYGRAGWYVDRVGLVCHTSIPKRSVESSNDANTFNPPMMLEMKPIVIPQPTALKVDVRWNQPVTVADMERFDLHNSASGKSMEQIWNDASTSIRPDDGLRCAACHAHQNTTGGSVPTNPPNGGNSIYLVNNTNKEWACYLSGFFSDNSVKPSKLQDFMATWAKEDC